MCAVQVLPALIPLEPFARAPVYTRQVRSLPSCPLGQVTARSCPFTGLGAEVARIQGGYANGLQVSTVCVYEGETDGSYMMSYLLFPSGAIIKRKLKKIEPFKPIKFARWAQEQFIETNRALQV